MTDLIQQTQAGLPDCVSGKLGVAVSGGGDSMALLALVHKLSETRDFEVCCVTVDHGLRTQAASEAWSVAQFCTKMGITHDTLEWRGWDGSGNTQNAARQARYALMADWAHSKNITDVALGHTQDDQAETVLMRLARAAGVDGLCAMAPTRRQHGVRWLRPLLDVPRARLRDFLRDEKISWHDDPSNEDPGYDRIKARQALDQFTALGIDRAALAQVARNMQDARCVLDRRARAAAGEVAVIHAGALKFDWTGLGTLPVETRRRLIVAALKWTCGSVYAPRHRSVTAALEAVQHDASATLDGCRLWRKGTVLWIFREYNVVRDVRAPIGSLWDGCWRMSGPPVAGDLYVAALGEAGLKHCPNWRETGLPRALLLASPAVWKGANLLSAPVAGHAQGWTVAVEKAEASLFDAAITH